MLGKKSYLIENIERKTFPVLQLAIIFISDEVIHISWHLTSWYFCPFDREIQCPGQTLLSITSLPYYHPPFHPLFLPHPVCSELLGSGSCDPPWASSTLTDDDNILNWSGSPISGTQTQISGSSPVKRASGTLPRLPNLNQQRSCENDRAWTATAFALPPSCPQPLPGNCLTHILFCISFSLSKSAYFFPPVT